MNNSNPQLKSKDSRKFNHWQYKFLKLCSEKGNEGIERWNNWRKKHPKRKIFLEGADLKKLFLRKINLSKAFLYNAILTQTTCHFTNFEGATLLKADLSSASLFAANLKDAKLGKETESVELTSNKSLKGSYVLITNIKGLDLGANFNRAILRYVDLRGANLAHTHLYGSDFRWAKVDGATTIRKCEVYRNTDFRGVALDLTKIDVATKQLLEHNIRQRNWEEWYKEHPKLKYFAKPFWLISDYGLYTGRIIFTFLILSVVFACIYYLFGRISPPGIVDNLFVDNNGIAVQGWLVPLRALYFSIVTMTTLGFGDMYANAHSVWGHILLSFQVILGYVLLGALVTRFAVLFTAGGPAGKFADDKEKK